MSSNASATPTAQRHPRILACVLCQHRKIKCDRNTPCSNCVKANVACTPSTPAPARKRRRPNQDLQERLARCEALLKQYAGSSAPSAAQMQVDSKQLPEPAVSQADASPSIARDPFEKPPAGKMIQQEGGARFIDSRLWTSFYDELQAMRQIVDTEDPEESSALGTEGLTPDNNAELLVPGDGSPPSVEENHPDPIHAFKLWQIFLDRVNPLTKIIHVPTLQPYVIEATTDPSHVPLKYQALLFSIYLMAIVSLDGAECYQLLGTTRDQALQKFTSATRHALLRSGFLRNYDMAIVQTLLLFLLSLQGRYDRHAAWVLSGTIIRIAQKMGYHRDGELLNLPPFETEMRRRIWWQILLQDTKLAVISGLNHSFAQDIFDTKEPHNLNDADLFPDSTEPIQSREGPTEMGFVLINNRLTKFMISESTRVGFETAMLGQDEIGPKHSSAKTRAMIEKYRAMARDLDQDVGEIERKYLDPSAGGVHSAALCIRPMVSQRLQEMLIPMKEQPEWGTEIFGPKDHLFKIVLMNIEYSMDAYERLGGHGFLWMMKLHFQLDVFGVLTGQLCKRPTGSLSDRGWAVAERVYKWHPELFDVSQKQCASQAQFTLKAWKAREQAFIQQGRHIETPIFITRLRDSVPSQDSRSSRAPSTTPSSATQSRQPSNDLDEFFGGYLDVSALNWDMWGDMASNNSTTNNNQMSAAFLGGFGLGNMGTMGDM